MKLVSANHIGHPTTSQTTQHAQVRIVILTLVSFLLGVAVTAFWFHFALNRNAGNASPHTSSTQTGSKPVVAQPVEPVVNVNRSSRPPVPFHPPVDSATLAEVKQAIPNYASVSLADGEQILREAALKQFTAAAKEMDVQIKQARQQLVQAQNNPSAAVQEAARKHLQQIQSEGTKKIQELAAHLQSQIAALKQLKGTTQ